MPGLPEVLVVVIVVLLVFGAGKLPQIGDALGRSVRNFKRAMSDEDKDEPRKAEGAKKLSEPKREGDAAGPGDASGGDAPKGKRTL